MLVVAEPSTANSSAIVWCWWCASALAAAAASTSTMVWSALLAAPLRTCANFMQSQNEK
jgi:hypothetical protein